MKLSVLFLTGVAAMVSLPQATGAAEGVIDICAYKAVFTEEFNDLSVAPKVLNGARWISHTPWNGDFGDARFTNDAPGGPFSIKDGMLYITARKDEAGKWRSGLLSAFDGTGAGFGVRYGYFEARMRLPPGPGTWPSFWLMTQRPHTDKTPNVEIDIIEYYGHRNDTYSAALHVWYKGEEQKRSTHTVQRIPVPAGSLVDTFHTYGVRVTPDTITYFLDRKPVWQKPTPPELNKPLSPFVNLALGSGFPIDQTPNPSVLVVDYVRAYAPDPDRKGAGCTPLPQ